MPKPLYGGRTILVDQDAWDDDVAPSPEVEVMAARIPDHCQHAGEQSAVDAQTTVRRQDDLGQVILVVGPLIDHVVRPAADQGGDGHDDQAVDDPLRGLSALARQPEGEPRSGEYGSDVADAVPANLD